MRGSLIDGATRLLMLVLAITTSLAILGAIAAMSEGAGGGHFPLDPRPVVMPERDEAPEIAASVPTGGVRRAETSPAAGAVVESVAVPAHPEPHAESWLEAIAYILVAIAALIAIAGLVLWRLFAQLRRIADALERR